MIFEGAAENCDEDWTDYYKLDRSIASIKGLAIIIVAYSFQINLFPMYNSLKDKTTNTALKAVTYTITITGLIYMIIPVLGVFFFGHIVD